MKRIVDECCDCAVPSYPCNDSCPLRAVERYFCDECDEEVDLDELYEVDGEDLCIDCLKERFKKAV